LSVKCQSPPNFFARFVNLHQFFLLILSISTKFFCPICQSPPNVSVELPQNLLHKGACGGKGIYDYLRKFKTSVCADVGEESGGGAEFFFGVEKICVAFTKIFFVKAEENFSLD
jgi:hypothetical protein